MYYKHVFYWGNRDELDFTMVPTPARRDSPEGDVDDIYWIAAHSCLNGYWVWVLVVP